MRNTEVRLKSWKWTQLSDEFSQVAPVPTEQLQMDMTAELALRTLPSTGES